MITEKRTASTTTHGKKRVWRFRLPARIVSGVCAILLILLGSGFTGGGIWFGTLLGTINYENGTQDFSNIPDLPPDVDDGSVTNVMDDPTLLDLSNVELRGNTKSITNVMLIGVDGRKSEGFTARSDTNIILSVNKSAKTIKLASLLRDVWVPLSGRDQNGDGEYDYDKLNAAFYYGGFNMLSNTIADTFRIKIDKYIAVDFVAFEKAVDALGGIDIELTADEAMFIPVWSDDPDRFATPDNPDLESLGYEAGVYHLNGQQTLAYCRIRSLYPDNDFERQNNQRKVIDLLMQKAKTMNFGTLTNVLMAVLPYVQTNMSQQELFSFAAQAIQYIDYDVYTDFSLPSGSEDFENYWIGDGLGLWLTDAEASTLQLHQYIYGDVVSNRLETEEDPEWEY